MTTPSLTYDLCIVGAGLIGSAAARHASLIPGTSLVLIGPPEPKERLLTDERDIYGAHYDEGRITSSLSSDPADGALARHSESRFRQLEKDTGIRFYEERGDLLFRNANVIKDFQRQATSHQLDVTLMGPEDIKRSFPYFKFPLTENAIFQTKNAGTLNPRRMLMAEQKLAERQGCEILREVVDHVTREVQSNGSYVMRIVTSTGRVLLSKRVLLTTGSFTTFRILLPAGVVPQQNITPLVVAMVQVDENEAAKLRSMPPVSYYGKYHPDWYKSSLIRLDRNGHIRSMPPVSYYGKYHPDWYKSSLIRLDRNGHIRFYLLPPIKYPDGGWYLKLGIFHDYLKIVQELHTSAEVKSWFCTGDKEAVEVTAKLLMSLFTDLKVESYHGDSCAVTDTITGRPYIDKVHDQLGVAFGGNGNAARSFDEIGRIAACMMTSGWDSEIPPEHFRLKLANMTNAQHCPKSKI